MSTHIQLANTLIAVDSDPVFLRSLQRALERRDFDVTTASNAEEARALLSEQRFEFASFELRLEDGSGLDLLDFARAAAPDMRCVILTAYGNLPTAVSATKLGAVDYLAKPTDADTIEASLRGTIRPLRQDQFFPRPEVQEFRYLFALYEQHGRNLSETARAAGMHRRTLQRILRRHGVGPAEQIPAEERTDTAHLRRLYRVWSEILDGPRSAG